MKKLMILAVMLAIVAAAAIPALAQDKERDAGNADGNSGGSVVANTEPADSSDDGNVAYNADPSPADGSSEISVDAPAGASTSDHSSEIAVPAPSGGSESGGCSDADKVSLRSAPADNGGDDSGSVTAASAPGCSEFRSSSKRFLRRPRADLGSPSCCWAPGALTTAPAELCLVHESKSQALEGPVVPAASIIRLQAYNRRSWLRVAKRRAEGGVEGQKCRSVELCG